MPRWHTRGQPDRGLRCPRAVVHRARPRAHTDLDEADVAWLQLLQADWQIIADLSFADLVLWLRDRDGTGFWAAAQMRPTTGPTAYVDDVVGTFVPPTGRRPLLDAACAQGRHGPRGRPGVARRGAGAGRGHPRRARRPGDRRDRPPHQPARRPHAEPARALLPADRRRPDPDDRHAATSRRPGQRGDHADSPRVGDGFLRVDAAGRVVYASPNAQSVYRRLGLSRRPRRGCCWPT